MSRILELLKAAEATRQTLAAGDEPVTRPPPAARRAGRARFWKREPKSFVTLAELAAANRPPPDPVIGEAPQSAPRRAAESLLIALAAALGYLAGSLFPFADRPFDGAAPARPEAAGPETTLALRLETRLPAALAIREVSGR